MRKGIKSAIAVIGIVGLMGAAGPAALANDRDVERRGSCSGRSDWKLKLSPEDGGLEVEFEVDQNRVGHRWRVKIRQNGERIFRGVRETRGPSGSFEVRTVTNNTPGVDRFKAKAVNLSTGETCVGRASF
jgi:hypothetical protein